LLSLAVGMVCLAWLIKSSRPVAYYAYLLKIFNSFLRSQNRSHCKQKQAFFRSSIIGSGVEGWKLSTTAQAAATAGSR
ncbi:MAG TPA: hypothetical protein VF670_09455, partial [Duganella sp.]